MSLRDQILADGPTDWWRFNEVAGTTFANEVGGRPSLSLDTGSVTPGVTGFVTGNPDNYALRFSSNGRISVVDQIWNSSVYTVEFVARSRPNVYSTQRVFDASVFPFTTGPKGAFISSGGFKYGRFWPSTGITATVGEAYKSANDAWHHYMMTCNRDIQEAKIFVDGQTAVTLGIPTDFTVWGTIFYVGAAATSPATDFCDMDIQDLVVYGGSYLSQTRAIAHYNAIGVAESTLTGSASGSSSSIGIESHIVNRLWSLSGSSSSDGAISPVYITPILTLSSQAGSSSSTGVASGAWTPALVIPQGVSGSSSSSGSLTPTFALSGVSLASNSVPESGGTLTINNVSQAATVTSVSIDGFSVAYTRSGSNVSVVIPGGAYVPGVHTITLVSGSQTFDMKFVIVESGFSVVSIATGTYTAGSNQIVTIGGVTFNIPSQAAGGSIDVAVLSFDNRGPFYPLSLAYDFGPKTTVFSPEISVIIPFDADLVAQKPNDLNESTSRAFSENDNFWTSKYPTSIGSNSITFKVSSF